MIKRTLLISVVLLSSAACALLLTGTSDPGKVAQIMTSTNAAGCIYTRASATPWASITTIVVGAWGTPRPALDECWQKLPSENP